MPLSVWRANKLTLLQLLSAVLQVGGSRCHGVLLVMPTAYFLGFHIYSSNVEPGPWNEQENIEKGAVSYYDIFFLCKQVMMGYY